MELSKQVCSLELSKRLKELGVKQESLFVYDEGSDRVIFLLNEKQRGKDVSAFTVAELCNMLRKEELCDNIIARWINADYLANKLIKYYEKLEKK